MGKLHTLHRAIVRDPAKWSRYGGAFKASAYPDAQGQWQPSYACRSNGPYQRFVTKTLNTLRESSSRR